MAGLLLCGVILTAGPVVYETVEKVQFCPGGVHHRRGDRLGGVAAWSAGPTPSSPKSLSHAHAGLPQFIPPLDKDLTPMLLLGALAFAGAGGTMNLCQSNYIRDKGYAMGRHIGRITSPLTGQRRSDQPRSALTFPHTPENLSRWRAWFRGAGWEHFFSFFLTCIVCLTLLTLICYICFFDAAGQPDGSIPPSTKTWASSGPRPDRLAALIGPAARWVFLLMGVAILFTTEFGVLDAASRISTDIVKVTWLGDNPLWSQGRLYFTFLWAEILLACAHPVAGAIKINVGALGLFQLTAAMNGGVMFLYACVLLYMNYFRLPAEIRIAPWRLAILASPWPSSAVHRLGRLRRRAEAGVVGPVCRTGLDGRVRVATRVRFRPAGGTSVPGSSLGRD